MGFSCLCRTPGERQSRVRHKYYSVAAILASVVLLVHGNGLLGTLISLRGEAEGMDVASIGLMMSLFFGGYVAGTIFIPRFVGTIGHIRTFAGFASLASAVSLLYVLLVHPVLWYALRVVSGACHAGLIVVVESWLNGTAARTQRARVLAIYNIVFFGSWALSQQVLNLADVRGYTLFILVAIFFSLGLIPITLGRTIEPGTVSAPKLDLRRLYKISPMGAVGAVVAGLSVGAFLGLGPVFARSLGTGVAGVSHFMSTTMLGGILFLWPMGWLSDNVDRRKVIMLASSMMLASGLLMAWIKSGPVVLLPAALFGGGMFTIFSLSAAQVNDHLDVSEFVASTGRMLFLYGSGAIAGPVLSSAAMWLLGPVGLPVSIALINAIFLKFALYRLPRQAPVPSEEKKHFVWIPKTTQVVLQLLRKKDGALRRRGKA